MIRKVLLLAILVATLRRWLLTVVAVVATRWPKHRPEAFPSCWPAVLLVVPFRNERAGLQQLPPMLANLAYPSDRLQIVWVDDGSTDGSADLLQAWLAERPAWHLIKLSANRGKAVALNEALRLFTADYVAVYDADERPLPDALSQLVAACMAPGVGAVNGRRAIDNGLATAIASYATFENMVHQLITARAKEALALFPPLLGSHSVYRYEMLAAVGFFSPGVLLEDAELTVEAALAGWQTRFVETAVSYHSVPQTVVSFWQQHVRWSVGFHSVLQAKAKRILASQHLTWGQRIELLWFTLGYLDRTIFLLAAAWLHCGGGKHKGLHTLLFLNLTLPIMQPILVLAISHSPFKLWRRLCWLPLFFCLDMFLLGWSLLKKLCNRPIVWESRESKRLARS